MHFPMIGPVIFSLNQSIESNMDMYIYILLVGGFNPSENYESQLGSLFPIYGKI